MASDEGKEGFSWIFDTQCDEILSIDILEGPPAMDEKKEEKKPEKKEEGEKEEKRLRDGHEGEKEGEKEEKPEKKGDASKTYMSFTGKKAGECKFSMAYADSTNETFEDATSTEDKIKVVSFDVQV